MNKKIKALIAVGGTGGHVFPGINLASALIKKNYSVKMVTDKRGYKFFKETDKKKCCFINFFFIADFIFNFKIFVILDIQSA